MALNGQGDHQNNENNQDNKDIQDNENDELENIQDEEMRSPQDDTGIEIENSSTDQGSDTILLIIVRGPPQAPVV